jgi:O-antigen/teichoic acid export membrane protein
MTKATEMARVSAKGGFHVMWGLILSTIISAVGTIFIARILGADNYGLYGIALTAPNLIATIRDLGITTGMIKYSAQYNSEGDVAKIRSILFSGLLFEALVGVVLTLVSFGLSDFLAVAFSRPTITPLIQIASFFVLTGALMNTAAAAFTGLERMHLNSIVQIVQSTLKTVLILVLVILGLGTTGAVWGYTLSTMFAGIMGVLLVYVMYKSLPKPPQGHRNIAFFSNVKLMIKYGLPVSIGTIVTAVLTYFYTFIMAIYVTDNAVIGNYNVALNFIVLITFFASPVTTMMLPAFSKLNPETDRDLLKGVFQFSVKYASLLIVPVTVMVMALAQPAIDTVFQNQYVIAPLFLALLAIQYLYTAIGYLSAGNLLNGQGYTGYNLKITMLTAALGFPTSFILISQFGVIGLIVTTLIVCLPGMFLSLRFIKNHFGVGIDWPSSIKISISSGIAGILTYLMVLFLNLPALLELIIGVVAFVVLFVLIAVLTRTINKTDVKSVRDIVNSLGPLRGILNVFVSLVEKLINFFQR